VKRRTTFAWSTIVFLSVSAGLAGLTLVNSDSAQAAACAPVNLWFNTGGTANNELYQVTPTGTLVSTAPLTGVSYGDIAFNEAGTALYGIQFTSAAPQLVQLNPATGLQESSVTVTGIPAGVTYNSLTALPNGDLLMGSGVLSQIYDVNPTTGAATLYAAYPVLNPPLSARANDVFWSAGDFVTRADGDIVAVAIDGSGVSSLFRIHPDRTMTLVGTVPIAYGAAESGTATGGSTIYFAGSTGNIFSLTTVPTAQSYAPLPITVLAATGLPFYGAASLQDASGAGCTTPVITSALPSGGTVGSPYSHAVVATGTGIVTFAVTAGVLPAGLSLDPASGVISGTPSVTGTSGFTITASSVFGSDVVSYSMSVASADDLPATGFDPVPVPVGAAVLILSGILVLRWRSRRPAGRA